MKNILTQLRLFIQAQKAGHWITLLLLSAAGVYVNYFGGLKQWLRSLEGIQAFTGYFMLYGLFTGIGYLAHSIFNKDTRFWKQPGFILLLTAGLAIFAFRSSFHEHLYWIEHLSGSEQASVNRLTFSDLFRLCYLVIPVTVIWLIADRKTQPLYGLTAHAPHWKTYFLLLACMIPLVLLASTQSDFLAVYPRVDKLIRLDAPVWKLWLYELCYGLDFFSIELFFRGFMIMAFTRYVGVNAVLPVACFYLAIHFGKPMGEAISSFFGGTILGLIAWQTRSIYGGLIVHVGIAWMMEAGGSAGHYLFK